MYVNNNSAALNSWLNLNNTTNAMENTLAQLSSGYKINSAGDNPAGLAIAQNMQAQATALSQGSQNAQNGVSLMQTADGGQNQIQTILQSMYQLASQAASGTMNSTDTAAMQSEMNQYAQEITQITNTTTFNGLNLLGGVLSNTKVQLGPDAGTVSNNLDISLTSKLDAYSLGLTGKTGTLATVAGSTVTATDNSLTNAAVSVGTASTAIIAGNNLAAGTFSVASTYTGWSTGSYSGAAGHFASLKFNGGSYTGNTTNTYQVKITTGAGSVASDVQYKLNGAGSWTDLGAPTGASKTNASFTLGGVTMKATLTSAANASDTFNIQLKPMTTAFSFYSGAAKAGTNEATQTLTGPQSGATMTLTNGSNTLFTDTNVTTQAAAINASTAAVAASTVYGGTITGGYRNFTVSNTGTAATGSNGTLSTAAKASTALNITTQANAVTAMATINTAINTVSTDRGNVGALMNRLQFAYNDNQITSQNLTNARAGIMDADMAMQMVNLSQQQVLQQSGVAMLSQATAVPQALLKLLT